MTPPDPLREALELLERVRGSVMEPVLVWEIDELLGRPKGSGKVGPISTGAGGDEPLEPQSSGPMDSRAGVLAGDGASAKSKGTGHSDRESAPTAEGSAPTAALAATPPAVQDDDAPMHTDEEYIEYGAVQYRRGRAQAEYEAAHGVGTGGNPEAGYMVKEGGVPAAAGMDVERLAQAIKQSAPVIEGVSHEYAALLIAAAYNVLSAVSATEDETP